MCFLYSQYRLDFFFFFHLMWEHTYVAQIGAVIKAEGFRRHGKG